MRNIEQEGGINNYTISTTSAGTLGGTPTVGWVNYNGSANYSSLPDSDLFDFTDNTNDLPYTLTAMIRMENNVRFRVVCKDRTSANVGSWFFGTGSGGNMAVAQYQAGLSTYIGKITTTVLPENEFMHVALTYDGSGLEGGFAIYTNGVLSPVNSNSSGSYSNMVRTANTVDIGARRAVSQFSDGDITEVHIFGSVISTADIYTMATNALDRYP